MSDEWLERFLNNGFEKIEGWVDRGVVGVLKAVNQIQSELAASGGVLEIGVHHGRFFILLNGFLESPNIKSYAIDLFGRQERNIDKSGCGNEDIFKANLALYDRHHGTNVVILSGDSTRLRTFDLHMFSTAPPRMISIDGGHTIEHTLSDLKLSEGVITDGGVVILDDVINPLWPGVIEGALLYLGGRPTLWPVFMGYNKLILVPMSVHSFYYSELAQRVAVRKSVSLAGYRLWVA